MTDWRKAGQLADAHRVADLARDNYQSPAKKAIRDWVIAEIASAQPGLVLDLWGGGESADAMTDAGLNVLTVDDGRGFDSLGVKRSRAKRSLQLCAEEKGYEWAWGARAIVKNAHRCQAAFYDFMGQLCPEYIAALSASRHMDAVGVTVMPDHLAAGKRLPPDYWREMYESGIRKALDVKCGRVIFRRYQREKGHWAFVFVWLRDPSYSGIQTRRARERAGLADPDVRATRAANAARHSRTHRESINARARESYRSKSADPEWTAKVLRQHREWYANATEYRSRKAEREHERWESDPEFRRKRDEYRRRWRAERRSDPEYRRLEAEKRRERYHAMRAAKAVAA